MSKEQLPARERFSTFIKQTGTIGEQIQQATGLFDIEDLRNSIESRSGVTRADLLVPSACNQDCPGCFYNLAERNIIELSDDTLKNIDVTLALLKNIDRQTTFYPREPTTDLRLLPIYQQAGETTALTNGKILKNPGVLEAFQQSGITDLMITLPGEQASFVAYTRERPEVYFDVLTGIERAKKMGFTVRTFMPIFSQNWPDIPLTTQRLYNMGVQEIRFIRVIPVGKARFLPDSFFLTRDTTIQFLEEVNRTRLAYTNKIRLSLFGLSFGPNFYGEGVWKYLAGQKNGWPGTGYLCPTINRQYLGVVLGSNAIMRCFQGVSLPEPQIGYIEDGQIKFTEPQNKRDPSTFSQLRGNCAPDVCPYTEVCGGGCRTAAIANAIRNGDPEPESAGMEICVTDIFRREMEKDTSST